MRRKSLLLVAAVIALSFGSIGTNAQDKSGELSDIEDRLVSDVEKELRSWKRTSISPMEGSSDVVINQWSQNDYSVGVTIIRHPSDDEAKKSLSSLVKTLKAERTITDAGEEQYSMPNRAGSIAYRVERFTVYVDTNIADPDEQKEYYQAALTACFQSYQKEVNQSEFTSTLRG